MRKFIALVFLAFIGLDGCEPIPPSDVPFKAVFTPDGQSIVVSKAVGSDCFLYQVNLATNEAHRLTHIVHGCESAPDFSADGKWLAYVYSEGRDRNGSLIIASADGTRAHTLVDSKENNFSPIFVPHESRLLFLRKADAIGSSNAKGGYDLFSVDISSGEVTQLTHSKLYFDQLFVSPDGKKVIYNVLDMEGKPETWRYHTVIALLDAPEVPSSTFKPAIPDSLPFQYNGFLLSSWSHDGQSILFESPSRTSDGQLDDNLYRMDISSGKVDKLTNRGGWSFGFEESPDGNKMILSRKGEYSILDMVTRELIPLSIKFMD